MARATYEKTGFDKKPFKSASTLTEVEFITDENSIADFLIKDGYQSVMKFTFEPEDLPFPLSIELPIYIEIDGDGLLITKEPMKTKAMFGRDINVNRNIGALYDMLDVIGYKGGFNTSGRWENNSGVVINDCDIAADIMEVANLQAPNSVILVVGVKSNDNGDFYNVYKRILPNNPEGIKAADSMFKRALKNFEKDSSGTTPSNSSLPQSNNHRPADIPPPSEY